MLWANCPDADSLQASLLTDSLAQRSQMMLRPGQWPVRPAARADRCPGQGGTVCDGKSHALLSPKTDSADRLLVGRSYFVITSLCRTLPRARPIPEECVSNGQFLVEGLLLSFCWQVSRKEAPSRFLFPGALRTRLSERFMCCCGSGELNDKCRQ